MFASRLHNERRPYWGAAIIANDNGQYHSVLNGFRYSNPAEIQDTIIYPMSLSDWLFSVNRWTFGLGSQIPRRFRASASVYKSSHPAVKPADRTSPEPAQHAEVLFRVYSSIARWCASVRSLTVGDSADIVCELGCGIGLFGLR